MPTPANDRRKVPRRVALLVSLWLHMLAVIVVASLPLGTAAVEVLDLASGGGGDPIGSPQPRAGEPSAATVDNNAARHAEAVDTHTAGSSQSTRPLVRLWRAMLAIVGRDALAASAASEDFESGTLAGWGMDWRGSGGWFVYTSGTIPPSSTSTHPAFPFAVPNPPQGKFAAIADENSSGLFILYRDVRLDGRYRLRLTVFHANAGRRFGPTPPRETLVNAEQHYRIDLVSPRAPVDSIADEDVLANVFATTPADSLRRDPFEVAWELSPWENQTVRLRFAVGVSNAPLRAGIDDIRFERLP